MFLDLNEDERFEQITNKLSRRFSTYGFNRIKTSPFESYDLYSKVTGSVNRQEMIKVIDSCGKVLVLRPDVTIPITQKLSHEESELANEHRFYYIQEVFRQSVDKTEKMERTQAGVEYFSESSPEVDAEMIALAIHTLKDLGFKEIKIEIGHTAFFNEMVHVLPLHENEINMLQTMIQAKNIVEISRFLTTVQAEEAIKIAIEQIPFLYGKPDDVLKHAKAISSSPDMLNSINAIEETWRLLKLYELEEHIVIDFGLINRMNYYSGIVFQGYVERFGKPVLMGGRYDRLGHEFGADLPAIGFACEVESLVEASVNKDFEDPKMIDVKIIYENSELEQSITLAGTLRERQFKVLSLPKRKEHLNQDRSTYLIKLTKEGNTLKYKDIERPFSMLKEVELFME